MAATLQGSSKSNLNHSFSCAGIGVVTADNHGRIEWMNDFAVETLQIRRSEYQSAFIGEILPIDSDAINNWRETPINREPIEWHLMNKALFGNALPMVGDDGFTGLVCLFQKEDNRLLFGNKKASYYRLQDDLEPIFDLSEYGNWLCDGTGTVLALNKAAERLSNISAKEVVGQKAWYLLEKGYVDRSASAEVIKNKRRVSFVQYITTTNKYLLVTATPVFDEAGNIFRIVINEKDVTGLHELREELKHSHKITQKLKEELTTANLSELSGGRIVAESHKMQQVLRGAVRLAHLGASDILLTGESGVGKGLIAQFIHDNSQRREGPFIQINCAALPESLMEAELFGYEKGAFSGAHNKGKAGLIELAEGGTLFLDEIGDMSAATQAKLLVYLDSHKIRSLGSVSEKQVDCSVITATNQDLKALIAQDRFREDLYYRLKIFTLEIPPLRQRKADILELVRFYMEKYNQDYNLKCRLSKDLLKQLSAYRFPGNVRELKGLLKQAIVMSESDIINSIILDAEDGQTNMGTEQIETGGGIKKQLAEFEKQLLIRALRKHRTTRDLARYLGISQATASRRLKRFGLQTGTMQS